MKLKRVNQDQTAWIVISGRLDAEMADLFEASFKEMIADRPPVVAMDLSGLESIDSTSSGSLIKALNTVKNYGGEMLLMDLPPMIHAELKQSRLDTFFKILSREKFKERFVHH